MEEEKKEESTETKKEVVKENKPANISYSGNASITVKHGKRVISKKKYKNNGSINLFKFFAYSLLGTYESRAENFRPKAIRLFKIDKDTFATPKEARKNLKSQLTDANSKSTFIPVNTTAVEDLYMQPETDYLNEASKKDYASVTMHFIVPASQITYNSGTEDYFNCVCLYKNINNLETIGSYTQNADYNAYFLLVDDDDEWAETEISDDKTNLIIEWTLRIGNE